MTLRRCFHKLGRLTEVLTYTAWFLIIMYAIGAAI